MMKHRTFALFLALGLSLSLLSGCGPKESGSTSQPGGSTSSSQGSPDASQPDISLPDASAPDTSTPEESAPEAPQPPVDEPEAVAALALDKSDFSLFKAGSSYQLKATVSGVDAPKVTWTSSDETVAAVSQDGTVTAVGPGHSHHHRRCGGDGAACLLHRPLQAAGGSARFRRREQLLPGEREWRQLLPGARGGPGRPVRFLYPAVRGL